MVREEISRITHMPGVEMLVWTSSEACARQYGPEELAPAARRRGNYITRVRTLHKKFVPKNDNAYIRMCTKLPVAHVQACMGNSCQMTRTFHLVIQFDESAKTEHFCQVSIGGMSKKMTEGALRRFR